MDGDKLNLPGWLHPANRLIKALHRLGLPVGTIHVLTVAGRTSGQPRSTPVSPLSVNGHRYIIAALPQADWARNARASGSGQLSWGRRHEQVLLVEVTDADQRRAVMTAFPTAVPHGVQFFVRLGLVDHANPAEFAAAADRVAAFEVLPTT